jgi:hypothetical protein
VDLHKLLERFVNKGVKPADADVSDGDASGRDAAPKA